MDRDETRKVALASAVGTTVEWYDFFIYGTAAGLVFNEIFFSNLDPMVGTLMAYLTFAAGFLPRPFGGVIFGHFGDRLGRKGLLVAALAIMGVATFLIGLLPTYATAGIWAPILLIALRLFQGIGIGGEYGGAVVMAVEYAPDERRGFYGSWPQMGQPAGMGLGTLTFALLAFMPDDQFLAWGWRIPFLGGVILLAIGAYIRLKLLETPPFLEMKERQAEARSPFRSMLMESPRQLMYGIGTRWAEGLLWNTFGIFSVALITKILGMPRWVALVGITIACAFQFALLPVYGHLSDVYGRKTVYGTGVAALTLATAPAILLMAAGEPGAVIAVLVLTIGVIYPAIYGPLAAWWSELFPTKVRYTGVGSVYQISGLIASAPTPIIATMLLGGLLTTKTGLIWFMAYVVVVSLISLASMFMLPETSHKELPS